jgi:hypothetical protein
MPCIFNLPLSQHFGEGDSVPVYSLEGGEVFDYMRLKMITQIQIKNVETS